MMRIPPIGDRQRARSHGIAARAGMHAGILVLSMATCGAGNAQQTTHQPRPDPYQTGKSLDALQAEQRRASRTAIQVPHVATPEVAADTTPLFKLAGVSVQGASAIPSRVIVAAYEPYIGKTVSQADLVTIAGKIGDAYRAAGYHLSRAIIPPQDIKGGRIRIQVIEGRIAELGVKGNGADQFGVRSLLAPLSEEHPARLATLERQLLLVNDLPGVHITDSALEEIGTATGNFRLIVTVQTWRLYMAQGVDNWGSASVGPWQAYSTAALNSLLLGGDSLNLNLSTTPSKLHELTFGRLSYDAPVGRDGARLGAAALYSEVWPGGPSSLGTYIRTETYELKGSIVPLETRRASLWLTATAGYSDVSGIDSSGMSYRDHIRTVSLAADYKLQDDLNGWNYLTVIWRQGLDLLGASQQGDDMLSRDGASGVFSVVDYAFTRYQKLSDVWSVKLSVSGQWASAPLLISQQFYLGGAAYGPGYYVGDNGIAGSAELRFDQLLQAGVLKGYQLYGFIDRGAVWNVDSPDVFSLSSIGAGVRLYLAEQVQASIAVAWPFRYRTTDNDVRDPRILFSLSSSFKACPERAGTRCL